MGCEVGLPFPVFFCMCVCVCLCEGEGWDPYTQKFSHLPHRHQLNSGGKKRTPLSATHLKENSS